MWKWLEKVVGTYEKPLVLTNEVKPRRARTSRGRYKGDNKSTDDYNEAWVGGKAPKKKRIYKIKGEKYTIKKRMNKKR
jgi:hypothetical protein